MHFLTSLRGVAALLVVLYHIKHWLHEYPVIEMFGFLYNKGYLAVDFFFVLSGFIIAFNYREKFHQSFTLKKYLTFIYKRFARIYPLHIFILICFLSIPLAYIITGKALNQGMYSISGYAAKVFLVDLWLVGSSFWSTWNVPSWTISGEFFSYLLFPLLANLAGKGVTRNLFILSLCSLLIALSYELIGARSLGDNIPELGLLRCSASFCIGVCVFNLYSAGKHKSDYVYRPLFFILAILLVVLILYVQENHFYTPTLMGLMLLSLIKYRGLLHQFLEWTPLVKLGDISYSVYLTHSLILIWFNLLFVENGVTPSLGEISLYLVLVLVMSVFTYYLVEIPSRRWLNNQLEKRVIK